MSLSHSLSLSLLFAQETAAAAEKKKKTQMGGSMNFIDTGVYTSRNPLQGNNVSGRPWKNRPQKRTSTMITKTKLNNKASSWDAKATEQRRKKEIREREAGLKAEKKEEYRVKRERDEQREKRRMENELKSSKVQAMNVDKIGGKMRTMSKKELRMVKKSRVNIKTGVVEYVDAYAK